MNLMKQVLVVVEDAERRSTENSKITVLKEFIRPPPNIREGNKQNVK